jgi:zinc-ribbon domain
MRSIAFAPLRPSIFFAPLTSSWSVSLNDTLFNKKVCKGCDNFLAPGLNSSYHQRVFLSDNKFMEANMHCPNCGAKASARQKFCRACGLSLERFAQLLSEPPPDIEDKEVEQARRRLLYLESGAKLTGCVVGLAAWLLMASVIAGIGIRAIINDNNTAWGVMLLVMAVVSIALEGLLIYSASLHAKVPTQQPDRPAAPPTETTNKLLPEQQSPIAMSAIEQTTARLDEKIEPRR